MAQALDDVDLVLKTMASTIVDNAVYFAQLDAVVGDGDFGYSLRNGFEVVVNDYDSFDRSSVGTLLKKVGLTISGKVGGVSGPIWGTAFLRAGITAGDKTELSPEDVIAMLRASIAGIMQRGDSSLGDKTLLDALVPAVDSLGGGLYRAAAEPPRAVAPRLVAAAAANRVALVFGPEDHGLSNDDLKTCHQLITIPTAADYASLNLAQAVMVCCYELCTAAQRDQPDEPLVLATAERVEQTFQRLQSAFLKIGFLHADNPDHIMFALRRMLGRAELEERDVRILLALARQIEWYGGVGWQVMAQKEKVAV